MDRVAASGVLVVVVVAYCGLVILQTSPILTANISVCCSIIDWPHRMGHVSSGNKRAFGCRMKRSGETSRCVERKRRNRLGHTNWGPTERERGRERGCTLGANKRHRQMCRRRGLEAPRWWMEIKTFGAILVRSLRQRLNVVPVE